jgi:hypothetical protein
MYPRLAYVPFFFALDVAVAAWASVQGVVGKPLRWLPTERRQTADDGRRLVSPEGDERET